ncbi:NAD-dependent epimerase/dehydratase family protein [Streptomyces sp. NPDC057555]|uniref:NAD-dependent epimerase/dehydratase family protein n=1 Tax=Streptomyces sp. NPDC057555 TaxID=3346166 RepID=UPI0036901534
MAVLMRIVVTGATGYLGTSVVNTLSAAGHDVVALGRTSRSNWPAGVHAHTADLADRETTGRALHEADAVCHLAALMRVTSPHAVGDYYRTNVTGTLNLLDAIAAEHVRTGRRIRMVFLSSAAVYGAGEGRPLRETDPAVPTGAYGRTKLAAEHAVASYAGTGAVDAVTLRLFNAAGVAPAGRAPDPHSLIPQALACAAHGRSLCLRGDGSAIRDFVHICDVVHAIELALQTAVVGAVRTYNIGAIPARTRDVIDAAKRISRRTIAVDHRPAHPNEVQHSIADTTAAREQLGWTPQHTTLEDLISDHWRRVHAGHGIEGKA